MQTLRLIVKIKQTAFLGYSFYRIYNCNSLHNLNDLVYSDQLIEFQNLGYAYLHSN